MIRSSAGHRWLSGLRRLLVVAGLSCGLLLASASAASAHAVLEHTSPADGAVLTKAPALVTLTFGEDVGVNSQDVQVFNDQLRRVDEGDAGHITNRGDTVGVRLPSSLKDGTYTVTWRVISADSHPVSGGFTFSVGHSTKVAGKVGGLGGGSRAVGVLLGAMRFLGYLGLVAGPGGLAFLLLWPGGRGDEWVRFSIGLGIITGLVSAAGMFILQAPYSQGRSIYHTFDHGLLSAVAHSHFGKVIAVRAALWVILGVVALALAKLRWPGWRWVTAAVVLVLPATWADAGHGAVGSQVPLALASEYLHVLAVSVWMGGLLLLSVRALHADRATVFEVLPRFSAVALAAVSVIVVTGFYQAWREVGLSWAALVTTTYGRIVAVKILAIIGLLGLGAFARLSLGAVRARGDSPDDRVLAMRQRIVRAHLRQSVVLELELGVVVLVLTSILVNTIPAKEAVDVTSHRTLHAPGLQVDVTVAPSRVGSDTITVVATNPRGGPQPMSITSASLNLPSHNIDSLPVTFHNMAGYDQSTATETFALSGKWQLTFEVQTSPIDATQFSTSFTVH